MDPFTGASRHVSSTNAPAGQESGQYISSSAYPGTVTAPSPAPTNKILPVVSTNTISQGHCLKYTSDHIPKFQAGKCGRNAKEVIPVRRSPSQWNSKPRNLPCATFIKVKHCSRLQVSPCIQQKSLRLMRLLRILLFWLHHRRRSQFNL